MKAQSTARLTFLNLRVLVGFALYAAGLVLAFASMSSETAGDDPAAELNQSEPAQATGRWRITGDLVTARYVHKATLLQSGQVLVAGGYGPDGVTMLASAELYDPVTGVWTATGSMTTARVDHTATLLPNGKVLVAGSLPETASAEVYDPATGVWTATGSMRAARSNHTATLLPNGQVLVAGGKGIDDSTILASAELYDPATGVWTATGSMNGHRTEHTATLLPNGQVLVAGFGSTPYGTIGKAELYDPATGSWTTTGQALLPKRFRHTATLLRNGTVLVSGGYNGFPGVGVLALADLYKSAPEALDIE